MKNVNEDLSNYNLKTKLKFYAVNKNINMDRMRKAQEKLLKKCRFEAATVKVRREAEIWE